MSMTLYDGDGVSIERSVARFGNTSYPIANIGAVSVEIGKQGSVAVMVVAIALAVVLLLAALGTSDVPDGEGSAGLFFLLGLASVFWAYRSRPKSFHTLVLNTSSGNVQAFSTKDPVEVRKIRDAILSAVTQMNTYGKESNGS